VTKHHHLGDQGGSARAAVGSQPNTRTTLLSSIRTSTLLILPAGTKPQLTASTNGFWQRTRLKVVRVTFEGNLGKSRSR